MTARTAPYVPTSEAPAAVAVARVPRLRPLTVFTIAAVLALFAIVFARVSLDKSAFELQRIEQEIAVEQARLAELRVEVARLRDPARIERVATEMGLVFPDERIPLRVEGRPLQGTP
ncbi:MAG TPA: cell division protein FtsL [Actinobacteria bacterium]|nr:cell division protein FtsL [Actinomycetota bacterium]